MTDKTPNPRGMTSYRFTIETRKKIEELAEHHMRTKTNMLEFIVAKEYDRVQREQGAA